VEERFEYRIIREALYEVKEVETVVNKLGKEGWELVSVTRRDGTSHCIDHILYFKRRLP